MRTKVLAVAEERLGDTGQYPVVANRPTDPEDVALSRDGSPAPEARHAAAAALLTDCTTARGSATVRTRRWYSCCSSSMTIVSALPVTL